MSDKQSTEQDKQLLDQIINLVESDTMKGVVASRICQLVSARLEAARRDAEEYWRTYYGMTSAEDDPPYDKLTDYQRKVLSDYHSNQLAKLANNNQGGKS